jgi:hypothetical protein
LKKEILALGKSLQKILQIDIGLDDVVNITVIIGQGIPDLKALDVSEGTADVRGKSVAKGPKDTTASAVFKKITEMRKKIKASSDTPDPEQLARNYAELLACAGEFSAYCNLRNALCNILKDNIDVEATTEIANLDEIANNVVDAIYSDRYYAADDEIFKDKPNGYAAKMTRIQDLRRLQKEWKKAGATFDLLETMLGTVVKSIDKRTKPNQTYLMNSVQTKCTEKSMNLQLMNSFATEAINELTRT